MRSGVKSGTYPIRISDLKEHQKGLFASRRYQSIFAGTCASVIDEMPRIECSGWKTEVRERGGGEDDTISVYSSEPRVELEPAQRRG